MDDVAAREAMISPVGVFGTLRNDTGYLFSKAHNRLFDVTELPQSSFLLTDLFAFASFLSGVSLPRQETTRFERWTLAALFRGFALQSALLLCAISTAYCYRQDFYPLIDLLLFTGLLLLGRVGVGRWSRSRIGIAATVLISMAGGRPPAAIQSTRHF